MKEALQAVTYLKEEGHLVVSEEEHTERLAMCSTCEEYSKYVEDECGECGCPVATRKAWLASTCCPLRMWYGDLEKTELCDQQEQEEKNDR
jgi:hypothetical protein